MLAEYFMSEIGEIHLEKILMKNLDPLQGSLRKRGDIMGKVCFVLIDHKNTIAS